MNNLEIQQKVIECVANSLAINQEDIKLDQQLFRDLNADSLDFLDIMFLLEDNFGVELNKEDFNLIQHIGLNEEEAVIEGFLTPLAKKELAYWLPSLPQDQALKLDEVGNYITIDTIIKIVQKYKNLQ